MAAIDVAKEVEKWSNATVLEVVEFKNALEDAWGVTAAAPVAVAAPGGAAAGGDGAAAEEKSAFDVVLAVATRERVKEILTRAINNP